MTTQATTIPPVLTQNPDPSSSSPPIASPKPRTARASKAPKRASKLDPAANDARSARAHADRPALIESFKSLRDSRLDFSASDVRKLTLIHGATTALKMLTPKLEAFVHLTAKNGKTLERVSPDVSVQITRHDKRTGETRRVNANGSRVLSGFKGEDQTIIGGAILGSEDSE